MGNLCCGPRDDDKKESQKIPDSFNYVIKDVQLTIKKGIYHFLQVDAIVNATDHYLRNRSSSIICKAGIEDIESQTSKIIEENNGPMKSGEVIYTNAGKLLSIKYILHIVMPIWKGGQKNEIQILEKSIDQCLEISKNLKLTSLAFSDVFSGLYGIPKQTAADVLMRKIVQFAKTKAADCPLKQILFVHKEQLTILLYTEQLKIQLGEKIDKFAQYYDQNEQNENTTKQPNLDLEIIDDQQHQKEMSMIRDSQNQEAFNQSSLTSSIANTAINLEQSQYQQTNSGIYHVQTDDKIAVQQSTKA